MSTGQSGVMLCGCGVKAGMVHSVTGQLVDMPTCRLPTRSRTSQLSDWTARGLVNSWMLPPKVVPSCYVSVGILQVIKCVLHIFCSFALCM